MKSLAVLLAAISACAVEGQEGAAVQPSSKTHFVPERLARGIRWLEAYGKFPETINGIDPPELRAVVGDWFPMSWTRYVRKELIPDRQFIIKNLKLIPAKEFHASVQPYIKRDYPQFPQFQEDIVFLRYRVENRDYLLVESGEVTGRLILFVNVGDSAGTELPTISDVVAKGLLMRGVAWIEFENGGCLLVDKYSTAFPRPANAVKSNEWFDNLQKHASQASTVKKEPNGAPPKSAP